MPTAATPISIAAGQLFTGGGHLAGYNFRETAGAVAKVRLWDNTSAAGVILATVALAANGSIDLVCDRRFAKGVFAEIVSGAVEGSIFIG